MVLMDDSLQLLPAVRFLDLSRNRFARAGNLHRCAKLEFLDLGFNHLHNISSLRQIKSQLTKLVLKNNALVSVHGIATLTFLEALDISNNLLSKFKEIQSLAKLPSLKVLLLEGNPISSAALFREEVFSFFEDPSKVCLDGRDMLNSESWTVQKIKSRRLKEQALYGSYAPAEIVAEMQAGPVPPVDASEPVLERVTSFPKRKVSRLALIRDVEALLNKAADQEDSPRFLAKDGKVSRQDSLQEDHDKSGAIDLMQKVETLKEEGSSNWLQELKGLLDDKKLVSEQSRDTFDIEEETRRLTTKPGLKVLRRLRRGHSRRQRRSSEKKLRDYRQGSFDRELERSRSSFSEKDSAEQIETSDGHSKGFTFHSGTQSDQNSAAASPGTSGTPDVSSGQEDFAGPVKHLSSISDITKSRQHGSADLLDDEQTSIGQSFGSWRLTDEVIDSQDLGGTVNSPPHYDEKVLQKRQHLEEELLRLSFDSGCALSSSESESSSDNSLIMISGSSRSEDGSPQAMASLETEKSNSKLWDDWQNEGHPAESMPSNQAMPIDPSDQDLVEMEEDHSSATKEKATEVASSHQSPSCTDDIRANAGGGSSYDTFGAVGKKPRRRRKPRRVPTTELYMDSDDGSFAVPKSLNGSKSMDARDANLVTASRVSSSYNGNQVEGKTHTPNKISHSPHAGVDDKVILDTE